MDQYRALLSESNTDLAETVRDIIRKRQDDIAINGLDSINIGAGGLIYFDAGALKYKSPAGTITTLGPA